jgi:hypothetical protein
VEVPSDGIIADLQDKIKETNQIALARVDAANLEVWRLRNPQKGRELKQPGYLPNLRRLDVPGNGDEGDNESAWRVRGSW